MDRACRHRCVHARCIPLKLNGKNSREVDPVPGACRFKRAVEFLNVSLEGLEFHSAEHHNELPRFPSHDNGKFVVAGIKNFTRCVIAMERDELKIQ